MNNTKQKILNKALELYNDHGVSNVSIRQLAQDVGISHSNLIYHYPTQEDIILGLHDLLLQKAIELNKDLLQNESTLYSLYSTTLTGFAVVYDFRFFFKELQYVCNAFPKVKEALRNVEKVRSNMYRNMIEQLITAGQFRSEELLNEYDDLIVRIKIYSDHWLASSSIYDELPTEEIIEKYAYLLIQHFYPYFTSKGKEEYFRLDRLINSKNKPLPNAPQKSKYC